MIKRNSLSALFCAFIVFSMTCSSVAYTLSPPDSIRVKWMEGRKYILHKVEPKETWLHLSRRYTIDITDLKAANEGVEVLKIGQIINVPATTSETSTTTAELKPADKVTGSKQNPVASPIATAPVTTVKETTAPVIYKVKKGDTMYSLSKKFNVEIRDIKNTNKLTSDVLSEGQVLMIGSKALSTPVDMEASSSSVPVLIKEETPPVLVPATNPSAKETPPPASAIETATTTSETGVSPASGYEKPTKSISPLKKGTTGKTLMQVTETGVATWIQDAQMNPGKYYALHRSASIGTIVKITNRMNNQFVYVKVVGSLPDTGDNENIIIKVSQAVSSKLNALDPLFQVELSYGMLN